MSPSGHLQNLQINRSLHLPSLWLHSTSRWRPRHPAPHHLPSIRGGRTGATSAVHAGLTTTTSKISSTMSNARSGKQLGAKRTGNACGIVYWYNARFQAFRNPP